MLKTNKIAVLTGDLVSSTGLDESKRDRAFLAIHHACKEIENWKGIRRKTNLSRSRGDGWQVCIDDPNLALRAALFIQASLRRTEGALGTRISMATGVCEGTIPEDLNHAMQPPFVRSGRKLDALRGQTMMAHDAGGALGAATRLADQISQGWTQMQAQTISMFLGPDVPTRQSAADIMGKSRQSVDKSLDGAGYRAIEEALRMIEASQP